MGAASAKIAQWRSAVGGRVVKPTSQPDGVTALGRVVRRGNTAVRKPVVLEPRLSSKVGGLGWHGLVMGDPPRSRYRCVLGSDIDVRSLPAGLGLRLLAYDDDVAVGRLMERAYAGTIDDDLGDNTDGVVEVADWRAHGGVGSASFVAVGADLGVLSASLVARASSGSVWLSYVFTDPAWKGLGLGAAVVSASLRVLAQLPGTAVFAGVTDGNTPSERLLTALGFVRTGPVR